MKIICDKIYNITIKREWNKNESIEFVIENPVNFSIEIHDNEVRDGSGNVAYWRSNHYVSELFHKGTTVTIDMLVHEEENGIIYKIYRTEIPLTYDGTIEEKDTIWQV